MKDEDAQTRQGFSGLTVVSLESRMSLPMQKLLSKRGGVAFVAPSMKEVPLTDNSKAYQFFEDLEKGEVDILILMTGVATRTLILTLQTRYPKERILHSLSTKTKIVVRGPKPTAVCKMHNIPIAVTAPEPNTWREILSILSEEQMLALRRVSVLEYGISNKAFLEELASAGAIVIPVPVYQWALPDDVGPLNQALDLIVQNKADLLLFTTSVQVDHLLKLAGERGEELSLRRALHRVGICSIGPTTSEKLRDHQLFADLEAKPNKMDILVEQAAEKGREIVERKRKQAEKSWVWIDYPSLNSSTQINPSSITHHSSPLLRACRRQPNKMVPIWLMRQAGRYMAEYHLSRRGFDFLSFCKNPEFTAEATLTAVERLGVDAAIIFADILLLVEPMGMRLDYKKGDGPTIAAPIRSAESIEKLREVDVEGQLKFVMDAIKIVRRTMDPKIPLIGFCGAPYTMASYMVEGKGSKNSIPTKILMHENPEAFHLLMEKITTASIDYLNAQVTAGADLVQIFDSWVGFLSPHEYREYVLPHSKRLIKGVKKGIPVIHFGTQTTSLLPLMKEAGGDVISLDWRVDIAQAWDQLGEVAIQGNLDPALLFSKPAVFLKEAERILSAVGSRPGFIFNLGHGILPETPVDHVMALVDFVHDWKV